MTLRVFFAMSKAGDSVQWKLGSPRGTQLLGRPESEDIMLTAELTQLLRRHWSLLLILKDSHKEKKNCVEADKRRWCPKLPVSLFHFTVHVLSELRFISQMLPEKTVWFLGFSLYQWAGNTSKIKKKKKQNYHQQLPCGQPVSQMLFTWS